MTDAAHCDNEATIVPPKDDGAAFPRGEVWRTGGRSLEDRREKAEPFQAKDFFIMRKAMSLA